MSGFLLDINVISELVRPTPERKVAAWVEATNENLLYLSVLTLGEIRKGVGSVRNASRRIALEAWLDGELVVRFADRILPIDQGVADRWGRIAAQLAGRVRPLAVVGGLLAATALHHDLTLVTRNVKDVVETGVPLFDPWQ